MVSEYRTITRSTSEVAIKLGYKSREYTTFAELRGSKDDLIEVLLVGLFVFAVGAFLVSLLRN